MTTLRVIVDDILAHAGGRLGRYAEDLTAALIRTAPRGARVAGIVAASTEDEYALLAERLPGLRELHKSALARRELAAAWQRGFTRLPGSGMVHSTSLLAPLRRHDRSLSPGDQTIVTIHDALAWTHPELLPSRQASWTRGMGKRAERYADAIVVPGHAIADELSEHLDIADRIRVIGGAPSSSLAVPADAAERRAAHGLSAPYVVAVVEGDARNGFPDLAAAASRSSLSGVTVVALTAAGETLEGAETLTVIDSAPDADRAAILAGAAAFVQPSIAAGYGGALLDALSLGIPAVVTDVPALVETAAEGAVVVPRDGDVADALSEAIAGLLADDAERARLAVSAEDRAKAFTWRDAAEKVWQLHADL